MSQREDEAGGSGMNQREEVDRTINGLIKLSRWILSQDAWAKERASPMEGRVAHLLVFTKDGTYSKRLKLLPGFELADAGDDPPYHTISMNYDTFLALLAGDMDWGQALVQGWVAFDGPNYFYHAMLWEKGFKRYRKYMDAAWRYLPERW